MSRAYGRAVPDLADLPDWTDAACRHSDADFFPEGADGGGNRPGLFKAIKAAKAVCAVCPLIEACRDYAIDNGLDWGIWGGMTARARIDARRARKAKVAS